MYRAFAAEACFPVPPLPAGRKISKTTTVPSMKPRALEADCLVLVVGGGAEVGLVEARKMVADGVAALVPYARQHGVKLGLEPLHPMYAAERSVLVTIAQALELASAYAPQEVGLVLDVFHIWWDPQVLPMIAKSRGRIYGFHVNDWLVPLPDLLLGRGMMGDGIIDNRMLRLAVDQAGYDGPDRSRDFQPRYLGHRSGRGVAANGRSLHCIRLKGK